MVWEVSCIEVQKILEKKRGKRNLIRCKQYLVIEVIFLFNFAVIINDFRHA
jgi:hypothetical protein